MVKYVQDCMVPLPLVAESSMDVNARNTKADSLQCMPIKPYVEQLCLIAPHVPLTRSMPYNTFHMERMPRWLQANPLYVLNYLKTLSDRYDHMFVPTLMQPKSSKGLMSLRDAYGDQKTSTICNRSKNSLVATTLPVALNINHKGASGCLRP